ncbi:hypothetical protein GM661_00630 [Iocasia frigidifontis]|uniref:Uncharacterized protein n=1 Tax=Iocasia fonsfrigidae TaxID=2682810 RepID=A0A8A7KB60_9FIRM|nr:hypothetical protein [Iocasia fonsfrigidae]QTL96579.1 hypothetical protein GM661_00630 [Iocasia fonsfrigidae]
MIVVRFRQGRDDELREWYESLPKGDRSRVVREILEGHIKGSIVKNDEPIVKADKQEPSDNNIENKIDNLMDGF